MVSSTAVECKCNARSSERESDDLDVKSNMETETRQHSSIIASYPVKNQQSQ